MFSTIALLGALLAIPQAFAHQIPVVDGVIGGVPTLPREHAYKDTVVGLAGKTTPGKLRIVENSGVCETTPGVYQASGYGDLTSSESMWYVDRALCASVVHPSLTVRPPRFWFFAARENPDTAPLAIWLNGGVRLPVGEY